MLEDNQTHVVIFYSIFDAYKAQNTLNNKNNKKKSTHYIT